MSNLIAGKPDDPFTPPSNIVAKPCGGKIEYFLSGTENSVSCISYPTWTPAPSPTPASH
jgi:hypothetical protein